MTRIRIDDALASQLLQIGGTVEVLNSAGLSLGHFVPTLNLLPEDNCPYSEREMAEMRVEQGGCTLEEIWRTLGAK